VTGEETDTFSRSPTPVKLRIDALDPNSGSVQTLATASLPDSAIDLGSLGFDSVAVLQVYGLDSIGSTRVFGASLPIQYGALDGTTLPLFVQRTGEFARMPAPCDGGVCGLSDSRQSPVLSIVGGRFLFIGGGSDSANATSIQLYDFTTYAPQVGTPKLHRVPKSIAFIGTVAWLIDSAGATQFDISNASWIDVAPPMGGTFAEVAGGSTVSAIDGSQFIVGATRLTDATDKVLALDPKGNSSWLTLSAKRAGAAASWVPAGLVVVGGSPSAAGVEIIRGGTVTGSPLPYPPDVSMGAGAAALDPADVLVAGGLMADLTDAGVRAAALGCATNCAFTPWSALPVAISAAQAFPINAANAVVVGSELSGRSHLYRLTTTGATEVATKVAHMNARAVLSPFGPPGSLVLFGGANMIESYTPPM
jgi:hypothetical protein